MISQQDVRPSVELINIINNLRTKNIPSIPDSKWKEILNEQDFDNYIFQVREELLSRVFNEIQRMFLENQRVKYVVDCAYESWKKIICLNFFFHDPCNECYRKFSSWTPDPEPEPCKPDSWNKGNISMKKQELLIQKPEQIDTVLSDYQLIKVEEYPTENYYSATKVKPQIVIPTQESLTELDTYFTQYPFATTTPASISENVSDEIIVNQMLEEPYVTEEQLPEEELFYKRIKHKELSLPSIHSGLKITPQRKLLTYPQGEFVKKLYFPPLRLPVASSVRASVVESPPKEERHSVMSTKSVNLPAKELLVNEEQQSQLSMAISQLSHCPLPPT